MVNADGSDFSQFQRSRQDSLLSLDDFYDHAIQETNINRDRTRNRKYQGLSDSLYEMEDIKKYWDH